MVIWSDSTKTIKQQFPTAQETVTAIVVALNGQPKVKKFGWMDRFEYETTRG